MITKFIAIGTFVVLSAIQTTAIPADDAAAHAAGQMLVANISAPIWRQEPRAVVPMERSSRAAVSSVTFQASPARRQASEGGHVDYLLMFFVIAGLVAVQLRRTQEIAQRPLLRG